MVIVQFDVPSSTTEQKKSPSAERWGMVFTPFRGPIN
jgi:hypothetical protein